MNIGEEEAPIELPVPTGPEWVPEPEPSTIEPAEVPAEVPVGGEVVE
jgi:hypothetical protein